MIKLFQPTLHENEEIDAIKSTLLSGDWSMGELVQRFEENLAKYLGKGVHCATTNSGSSALFLAMKLYDIRNKEVLVPSLTMVATVHSILSNGGVPVFVDVNEKDLQIDVEDLKNRITKKTAMVLPVAYMGHPYNVDAVLDLSEDKEFDIIDDLAHATGTTYKGRHLGSIQPITSCFSFYPTKPLGMPSGGCVCCNPPFASLKARAIRELRRYGITSREGYSYDVKQIGYNMYPSNVNAAVGIVQLRYLDDMNNMRRSIAQKYNDRLCKLEWLQTLPFNPDSTYHLYIIRVKDDERDRFIDYMKNNLVECGIHYLPVHLFTYFKKHYPNVSLPITEQACREIVTLPCYPGLSDENFEYIISCIETFK